MKYAQGLVGIALVCAAAGCSNGDPGGPEASAPPQTEPPASTVTVLVHDSFALPEDLIAEFEATEGISVEFVAVGDAGTLVNQLVLTAGSPAGDAAYGIDNSFASRVLESDALMPFVAESAAQADSLGGALTAIDFSDVCFNIDIATFGDEGPQTLDDLLDSEYAGLVSVPNPATSSPGLTLLLATQAQYGEGWKDYWRTLRDNGLKVTASWSDSYFVDFAAPNYGGDYPIVLSYASSPPAEVVDGEPTTRALLDTCVRQTEYAGVLEGARNPEGGKKVIEWMLTDEVQSELPEQMYVYPISRTATIPQEWLDYAPLAESPIVLDPQTVAEQRDALLREWTQIVIDGQ